MDAELTRLLVDTLWTATKVASPILIVALVTGVGISLIQTVLRHLADLPHFFRRFTTNCFQPTNF